MKRGLIEWDERYLPPKEFERRVRMVKKRLEERQALALLAYGHIDRPGNVAYLSNFLCAKRGALLFQPRDGAATLVLELPGRDITGHLRSITWVADMRPGMTEASEIRIVEAVEGELRRLPTGSTVLVEDLENFHWPLFVKLQSLLPDLRIEDADVLTSLRRQKDDLEVESIRRTCHVATDAVRFMQTVVMPGRTEIEVAAEVERHLLLIGAEDVEIRLSSSDHAVPPQAPSHTEIRRNRKVTALLSVQLHRYWGIAGVTMSSDGSLVQRAKRGLEHAEVRAGGRLSGIGLELHEAPVSPGDVRPGDIVGLKVSEGDGFWAGAFRVHEEGIVLLTSSP